jgi:hypothetical protein
MGVRDVALRVRSNGSLMPAAVTALNVAVFLLVCQLAPAGAQQMALPAKSDVGATGAAAYSIPISIPPGTAGMTPALALSFSSQGSNGIVGMGWSLSGLPSINRCPQTYAQDGVRGSVNFDGNDRYCLDGQRLMAISGVYGADGAEYRTEIESFSRVISHGAAGNGPAWFEVHAKSGQIMEFGHTVDSLVLAQGKPTARSWAVNKVSDTKGNYFTVTYTNDTLNGQAYPTEIDYTGNAAAGLAPYNKVQFVYATRPDITPAYQAGSLVQTTVRLTNVQTYAGVNLVADYRLAYDATITNLSSLTSVTLCAADGSCLPPTSFAAASSSGGLFNGTTFTYPNGWNFGYPPPNATWTLITGDFNGDGKTDFAFSSATALDVFLGNGDGTFAASTFAYPSGWNFGAPPEASWTLIVGDFNGDGKTDFAFSSATALDVLLSNGNGTFSTNTFTYPSGWNFGTPPTQNWGLIVGDFNGDGRTDFAFSLATALDVFLSNGDGTFSTNSFTYPNGWNFGSPSGICGGMFCYTQVIGDFDGDGKTDFIFSSSTVAYVMLSKGDGTFSGTAFTYPNGWNFGEPRFPNAAPGVMYTPIVGDLNGDGKTDFAFAGGTVIYVMLSKGDGTFSGSMFTYPNGWNFTPNLSGGPSHFYTPIIGDFDGDGRIDFAFASATGASVLFSNGDGTFTGRTYTYPNGWLFGSPRFPSTGNPSALWLPIIGDFNGNGKTGFAFSGSFANTGQTSIYTFQAGGPPIYQLNAVTNGLGATTAFTYQPLTSSSVYTKGSGSLYPVVDLQAPIYVVSRVDSSNGIGGNLSAGYAYAGAKMDISGRGFLGFRQVTATDLQTNIVKTTTYRQDYPYIALAASETQSLGSATLNTANNAYGFTALGGTRYQVFLTQNQASSVDLDGSALPVVTSSYQYDAFGNATQVVVSATDGHSKATTSTYTNDTVNWLLGRLTNATVTSQLSQPAVPPPLLPTPAIVTISSNTSNFNLLNYLVANGLATAGAPASANVTIAGGVVINSTLTSGPAFDTGAFPSGSTLQITNNGTIVGAGGNGGAGASCYAGTPATSGGPGGPALRAQIALALANNGSIRGGGGGSGGGGGDSFSSPDGSSGFLAGGGGGGGAGSGGGGAGGASMFGGLFGGGSAPTGPAGSAGTPSAGGAGGPGETYTDSFGVVYSAGAGGNGGGNGLAGSGGSVASDLGCLAPGSAGAAGAAAVGNSFITWTTVGDRRGPLN